MSTPKTDLELMHQKASVSPFNPTTNIQKTNVQEAIEQAIANAALASEDFLVKTASSALSAERVVTDTSTIVVDWATAGQAKFDWQGLVTDLSPELGGDLTMSGFGITGDVPITGALQCQMVTNAFGTSNIYTAFIVGAIEGATANNGGLYAIGRKDKANEPFVGMSGWDNGTGRGLYFGGGGWDTPDATELLFYTAAAYSETNNAGVLRLWINGTTIAASLPVTVPDVAYSVAWDGSLAVPTRNAVYDKVEAVVLSISDHISDATGAHAATAISIADGGGYFTGTDVETALQELGVDVAALEQAVVLKGTWDASGGTFPGAGAAQAGWSYIVSVSGTVDGVAFVLNDRIVAITDNASTGTYAANWHKLDYTDAVLSVDGQTGAVSLASTYQPLDGTLTALAGVTVAADQFIYATGADAFAAAGFTSVARTLVAQTTQALMRTTGLGLSANGSSLVSAADYAAMRGLLDLEAGTDFVAKTGGVFTGAVEVQVSTATTAADYLSLKPTDFAANKPYFFIAKTTTADKWNMGLWDGSDANGTVNFLTPVTYLDNAIAHAGNLDDTLEYSGGSTFQRAALTGAIAATAGSNATTSTTDLIITIGDATNVIGTGATGRWFQIDFACTIVSWSILARESGSISIDVWRTTYSDFDAGATHPAAGDKISASAPITFTTTTKATDSSLSGWTVSLAANDVLAFNVASVTTCKQVTIILKVTKTS
jgi:hypothetical protein